VTARPEPTLRGPIKWYQRWLDVLFLHWSLPVAGVRPLVPAALEIDTHDGVAWVSLVLFRLQGRPWWLPFYAGLGDTNEVNFRTYVRCEDRPGVYFLSMHAHSRLAVWAARRLTPFPYLHGQVAYARVGAEFRFTEGQAPDPLRFRPAGDGHDPAAGSLDEWLTERYSAFADRLDGSIVEAPGGGWPPPGRPTCCTIRPASKPSSARSGKSPFAPRKGVR
jgi:uncharacterized protein YqjF (DUF2071 family)